MPGFKKVFGYQYHGELLISATWNALWSAMTFLGMSIGMFTTGYPSFIEHAFSIKYNADLGQEV